MDTIAATIAQLQFKRADADGLREVAKADGMNLYRHRDGSCMVERIHARTKAPVTQHFPTVAAAVAALGITANTRDGMREPWGYIPGMGWANH